jgi:hypothetical protein
VVPEVKYILAVAPGLLITDGFLSLPVIIEVRSGSIMNVHVGSKENVAARAALVIITQGEVSLMMTSTRAGG